MDDRVDVPGLPGYSVDRRGLVRGVYGKVLIPFVNGVHTYVSPMVGGRQRQVKVSRVVAAAFLGMDLFDRGLDVAHVDGDRSNCGVDNLLVVGKEEFLDQDRARRVVRSSGSIVCQGCDVAKPISEYYTQNGGQPRSTCKVCYRVIQNARRSKKRRTKYSGMPGAAAC